jgi:mono/diheme cytochrome c family protein
LLTSCAIFAVGYRILSTFFSSITAMISCKTIAGKFSIISLFFFLFSVSKNSLQGQDGRALFNSKCASCHNIFKVATGPALGGFQERADGKWADIKELHAWIKSPAAYMANDAYTKGLFAEYKSMMTPFGDITEAEVSAIAAYINTTFAAGPGGGKKPGDTTDGDDGSGGGNGIFFGIISLIMAIIALILMQVNSNLKKLSDNTEGISRPDPVPFYKNKVYIAFAAVIFFIIGGYYVTIGAVGLGRQKNYQPKQPIYYSHKVHAGINQISCLYCHGNAMESRHAAIPSTNVCMNCHKAITSYEKGPKLFDENGDEINGTAEIAKLYQYANFDPKNPNAWTPSMADSIPWVKIHNLPDHAYFNHSQHVKVGNVQCQTCHGEITAMDEVFQFSELSMGWCINCHRSTKVNFYDKEKGTGNKFYSIYEKFQNDIKSGKMDSVTVKDIGGLECQKCHY